jgi:predicted permease
MGWRRFFSRQRSDRDRADELDQHFDLLVDDFVARGIPHHEAVRRARLALGNPRAKREQIDDLNRLPILDTLARDVRYAVRMLRRAPAFTLASVVTLGLVIGGNAAVMSLADAILLRPLPYPRPDRLGTVVTRLNAPGSPAGLRTNQDGTSWEVLRDTARSVDVAVTSRGTKNVNVVVRNVAATARQLRVSAGYFRVLGVAPFIGREFIRDEDRSGGAAVAVLSHDFWERHLGRDPDIAGKVLDLRGEPHTVVGVMPASFVDPAEMVDLWTPVRPSRTGEGVGTNYGIFARVRDGYTWAQADGELAALGRASFTERKRFTAGIDAWWSLRSLQEALVEDTRLPIQLLVGAGAIVLLIACVNLAALLLARGGSRAKEIATRMALGSGRVAVVRQLVVESVVLGVMGGVAGIAVGAFMLEGLKALGGETFLQWMRVHLDARIIWATLGLSVLMSLLFGLLPAWQAARIDVLRGLASGGSRTITGSSAPWMRRGLVVVEVALGVVVLVAAGLLVRTYANLRNLDAGFNPAGVMTAGASLQDARYATSARVNQLFDTSLDALRNTPGVEAASVSLELPYRRLLNSGFRFSEQASSAFQMANVLYATPGFLQTLQIPLLGGRDLSKDDQMAAPPVVLVNETFANGWSKGVNPVGRKIWMDGAYREIVGVFGDVQVRNGGIDFPGKVNGPILSAPQVLVPAAQMSDGNMLLVHTWFQPTWSVRASPSLNAGRAIQEAVGRFDRMLPVGAVQSLAEVQAAAVAPQRLVMTLVGSTAALALLLAVVGVYGLIAHGVAARTRELGIRLALGATSGGTIAWIVAGGVGIASCGAAIGVGLAWMAVKVFDSLPVLFQIDKRDPATFMVVAGLLVIMAAVASLLPALRILRLDPATILRE